MRVFAAVSLALFVVACGPSYGGKIEPFTLSQFKTGQTTYNDVISTLGPPGALQTRSDGERFATYSYFEGKVRPATFIPIVGFFAGGADTQSQSVTFDFDPNGVLKSYTTSQAQACSGTGALSSVSAANCQPR